MPGGLIAVEWGRAGGRRTLCGEEVEARLETLHTLQLCYAAGFDAVGWALQPVKVVSEMTPGMCRVER